MPLAARYHPEALFVLRILQGLVTGFGLPAMFNLFSKWAAPSERTRLMSIAYTGFPLANVLIFPLASTLCQMEVDGGWPMIFYVTGKAQYIKTTLYIIQMERERTRNLLKQLKLIDIIVVSISSYLMSN